MQVIDNALSNDDIEKVVKDLDYHKLHKNMEINARDWDVKSVVHNSAAVFFHRLTDDCFTYNLMRDIMKQNFGKEPMYIAFQHWSNGSYIPWHDDYGRKAITIYLNRKWNIDDGGLLMFRQADDTIRAVEPIFNRAVINDDVSMHSVSMTRFGAPIRHTLQVFSEE